MSTNLDRDSNEDQEEEALNLTVGPPLSRSKASVEELQRTVKQSQLKEVLLEEKLKELSIQNAALQTGKAGTRRNKKANDEIPEAIASDTDTITKLGKKCCIFVAPWVSPSIFKKSRPSNVDISGTSCCLNAETREIANIEELYQFVPNQFHSALEKLSKFGDIFRGGMSAMRSTSLYTIRPHRATIFDTLDAKYFKTGFNRKEDDHLKFLIGWDGKSEKYSYWAPILFPDPNARKVLRYAFRNKSLPLILRVILFGPSSLSAVRRATPKTNGQLWGVVSVNDSAIAFSAILARFMLSGDNEFVETGNFTNIDYLSDFWTYRQFLATADEGPHDALINWFNRRVFIDRITAGPTVGKDSDDLDVVRDEDIAAFNEGVADDDEGTVDNDYIEDAEDDAIGKDGTMDISEDGIDNSSRAATQTSPVQPRHSSPAAASRQPSPAIDHPTAPALTRQATPRLSDVSPPPAGALDEILEDETPPPDARKQKKKPTTTAGGRTKKNNETEGRKQKNATPRLSHRRPNAVIDSDGETQA